MIGKGVCRACEHCEIRGVSESTGRITTQLVCRRHAPEPTTSALVAVLAQMLHAPPDDSTLTTLWWPVVDGRGCGEFEAR